MLPHAILLLLLCDSLVATVTPCISKNVNNPGEIVYEASHKDYNPCAEEGEKTAIKIKSQVFSSLSCDEDKGGWSGTPITEEGERKEEKVLDAFAYFILSYECVEPPKKLPDMPGRPCQTGGTDVEIKLVKGHTFGCLPSIIGKFILRGVGINTTVFHSVSCDPIHGWTARMELNGQEEKIADAYATPYLKCVEYCTTLGHGLRINYNHDDGDLSVVCSEWDEVVKYENKPVFLPHCSLLHGWKDYWPDPVPIPVDALTPLPLKCERSGEKSESDEYERKDPKRNKTRKVHTTTPAVPRNNNTCFVSGWPDENVYKIEDGRGRFGCKWDGSRLLGIHLNKQVYASVVCHEDDGWTGRKKKVNGADKRIWSAYAITELNCVEYCTVTGPGVIRHVSDELAVIVCENPEEDLFYFSNQTWSYATERNLTCMMSRGWRNDVKFITQDLVTPLQVECRRKGEGAPTLPPVPAPPAEPTSSPDSTGTADAAEVTDPPVEPTPAPAPIGTTTAPDGPPTIPPAEPTPSPSPIGTTDAPGPVTILPVTFSPAKPTPNPGPIGTTTAPEVTDPSAAGGWTAKIAGCILVGILVLLGIGIVILALCMKRKAREDGEDSAEVLDDLSVETSEV